MDVPHLSNEMAGWLAGWLDVLLLLLLLAAGYTRRVETSRRPDRLAPCMYVYGEVSSVFQAIHIIIQYMKEQFRVS